MEFKDGNETSAIVLGSLFQESGKLSCSAFNKVMVELGYAKVKRSDFKQLVGTIENNEHYHQLFSLASENKLGIEDLVNGDGTPSEQSTDDLLDIVSPYVVDKEVLRNLTSRYRKVRNQVSAQQYLSGKIADSIAETIKHHEQKPKREFPRMSTDFKGNSTLVITPADWHIGAVVFTEDNCYNYTLFKLRLQQFINAIKEKISLLHPDNILLVHLGDFIEGIDMRKINQPFETEMTATQQIARATEAMLDLVEEVGSLGYPTKVGVIGGNHDRFTADKKDAIYNDNIAYNILSVLKLMSAKEYGVLPENVVILDNSDDIYHLSQLVSGKNIMFVHGDMEAKTANARIPAHIKQTPIDYMFFGHYHYNSFVQEDFKRFSFMASSIMGANNYAKQLNLPTTQPSQLMTLFTEGSDNPLIMPIFFKE